MQKASTRTAIHRAYGFDWRLILVKDHTETGTDYLKKCSFCVNGIVYEVRDGVLSIDKNRQMSLK